MRKAKLLVLSILCLMIFAGCNRSNENVPIPTEAIEGTNVHDEIEKLTTMLAPAVPVGGITSFPMITLFPTGMPEQRVEKVNKEIELVPITEKYFSNEAFRQFIKEQFDINGDGFLSTQEREQVVLLEDPGRYSRGKLVLDGLNWFPRLVTLDLVGQMELYLDHHPGVEYINWNEMGASTFYAEGCDKLKRISLHMSTDAGVCINNCIALEGFSAWDGQLRNLYIGHTPNLTLLVDWYEEMPKELLLDDDVQVLWRLWSDKDEAICLDNIGTRFEVTENGILYWDEIFSNRYEILINWLGIEVTELDLDEQMKQMKKMYCASVPESQRENGMTQVGVKTILFSPQKNSVYMVGEWLEGKLSRVRYYIIEFDGTITEYVSLEEMIMASEQIDGLKNMKTMFFPE